jgi:hypothetical protein
MRLKMDITRNPNFVFYELNKTKITAMLPMAIMNYDVDSSSCNAKTRPTSIKVLVEREREKQRLRV